MTKPRTIYSPWKAPVPDGSTLGERLVWKRRTVVQRRHTRTPEPLTDPPTGEPFAGPDRIVLVTAEPDPKRTVRQLLFRFWQFLVVLVFVLLAVLGGVTAVRDPQRIDVASLASDVAARVADSNPQPDQAAEGYALRVARVWFTYSPETRAARRATVAELMPGAHPDIAWDGVSTSTVSDAWIERDYVVAPGVREVHVAVLTGGVVRLLIVQVKVDPATNMTALASYPTIGSQPTIGAVPADPDVAIDSDSDSQRLATPTVDGFLRAWGTGVAADVAVFTEGFTAPPGPGGLKLISARWTMPKGGAERVVNVLVRWADNAGRVTTAGYSMTLTTNGQRWSVKAFDVSAPGSIPFSVSPS